MKAFLAGSRAVGIGLLLLFSYGAIATAQDARSTEPLQFVSAFIDALGETEANRESATTELHAEKNAMSAMARISARKRLELRVRIKTFEGMQLAGTMGWVAPSVTDVYRSQLELHTTLGDIARMFLEGPKPGVDYAHLAATMPEISAQVEFLDQSLFKVTPAVFAVLIDQHPDAQNHVSHLLITRAERKQLVAMIDRRFGGKLDQKDQNWTVSSASVLRSYLVGDYKSSDDSW